MDSTHPSKKRRINSTIHKPFQSPLRVPQPATTAPPAAPSTHAANPAPPAPKPQPAPAALHSTAATIRALDRAALRARQDIDVLRQALGVARGGKGAELGALRERWRDAARIAAEEVFGLAKDRVNGMGGVAAWREREREAGVWRRGRLEDGRRGEGADEWEYDFEGVERDGVEGGTADGEEEAYGDDDTFTMDMMLKSLGIDLNLVGYSKERQEWIS